jgi:CelD/BcsL family acetyltransferase involved in cellulose biosynthesis
MGARVQLIAVAPAELRGWEPLWRELEAAAPDAAPFLCFDWLAAWARTHEPLRPAVVLVGVPEASLALGLLERASLDRWRFGGWPVSATRGLLVRPGAEDDAWAALGGWLREHPRRWATLGAEGVDASVPARLPRVRATPSPSMVLELPASFEAYLAGRPHDLRHALRRATRTGAELRRVPDGAVAAALEDFVRLHRARWRMRGERHRAMGERLAALLGALPPEQLYVDELVLDGIRLGVSVALVRGAVLWGYNFGVDPAALSLGPGIALQQLSIRDAIEAGCRWVDMGPGASSFKRRAGGVPDERVDVRAASPTPLGRAVAELSRGRALARSVVHR